MRLDKINSSKTINKEKEVELEALINKKYLNRLSNRLVKIMMKMRKQKSEDVKTSDLVQFQTLLLRLGRIYDRMTPAQVEKLRNTKSFKVVTQYYNPKIGKK